MPFSYYEKIGDQEVCIDDEIPFEIPSTWQWVRLEDCCSKEIRRGKSPKYTEKSSTLVFAQKCNTKNRGIDIGLALYLDESTLSKYQHEEFLQDGDIVINSTGTGTLGRVGIFQSADNDLNLPTVPDSHITVIRPCSYIAAYYLYAFLKSQQGFLEQKGNGSTNQKELPPSVLKKLYIPLPPQQEQARIITAISIIYLIIAKLEKGLN